MSVGSHLLVCIVSLFFLLLYRYTGVVAFVWAGKIGGKTKKIIKKNNSIGQRNGDWMFQLYS